MTVLTFLTVSPPNGQYGQYGHVIFYCIRQVWRINRYRFLDILSHLLSIAEGITYAEANCFLYTP